MCERAQTSVWLNRKHQRDSVAPESQCARYRHEVGGIVCAERSGCHRNDICVEQGDDAEDERLSEARHREGHRES